MDTFKKILALYAPFRLSLAIAFALLLAQHMALISTPYVYGKVIDCITAGKPLSSAFILALIAFALSITQMMLNYLREMFELTYLDYRLGQHTADFSMQKLLTLSIGQHENRHSGTKQSVIEHGEQALQRVIFMALYEMIPLLLQVVLISTALLWISFPLGSLTLAGVIASVWISLALNQKFKGEQRQFEDLRVEWNRFRSDILHNISLVLANAQEERVKREASAKLIAMGDFGKRLIRRYVSLAVCRSLVVDITRCAVLMLGIWYVYKEVYTPGYLIIFWTWSSSVLGQVGNIGNQQRRLMEVMATIGKYFEFQETKSDVQIVKNPIRPKKFLGQIEFRDVTFRYPFRPHAEKNESSRQDTFLTKDALAHVSFLIEPGERVAIIGASGAGKSTIVRALLRAQDPDEGQVLVDGHDLRLLDLPLFRRAIGIVDQSTQMLDETLGYNITYGVDEDARRLMTTEVLQKIARMARINGFLDRLEYGFDTLIGERGVRLSGGERQRVSIARALAKNPMILVFDEATSSLDPENEAAIREAIEEASEGRTTIIIAHRFSTIRNVDRIIVIDGGRVVDQGTPDELSKRSEHYRRMIRHQIS